MFRSQEEEKVNAYSHLISSIFCILSFLTLKMNTHLNVKQDILCIFLFMIPAWTFYSSFIYHISKKKLKKIQNRFVDKVGIYMMIMSSGIGFTLTSENLTFIISNLCLIVTISTFLIIKMCLEGDKSESFSLASYILMGWFCIIPVTGIFAETNFNQNPQMMFLILGSSFYLTGVIFYVLDKIKWFHLAWHLFSFLGFLFQGLSIMHSAKIL